MTFSPLISGTVPNNGKYSSRQGRTVSKVVQHHWAGTGGGIERMAGPDEASTTYLILTDGRILGHVPEEFRPWTSGSFEADGDAITIEVQNTSGQVNGNDSDPSSWRVSDAAYNSIIALLADVAHRYGWGGINSSNYRGHREFSSTACPGGYLWNRMDNTRAAAHALFSGGSFTPQGTTNQEEDIDMAGAADILARLDEIVAWQDQKFRDGDDKAERNRNALAGFVRDVVVNQSTLTASEIEARFRDITASDKSDLEMWKSDDKSEPTVYVYDAATGLRAIEWDEFRALMSAGAILKEIPKAFIDGVKKAGA